MAARLGASVQYGDWKGECAFDSIDQGDIEDFLAGKGLVAKGDIVWAFRFWMGENHPGRAGMVMLYAYLLDDGEYENVDARLKAEPDPVQVREVGVELSPDEFLMLFKRVSIVAERSRLGLIGRDITTE